MTRVISLTFFLLSALPAAADPFVLYDLTPDEVQMVEQGVAAGLLDPESARFTGLVASRDMEFPDPQFLGYVCGNVSGRNTFGGYAPATPFIGSLVVGGKGKGFILISIAGPSNAEQLAVLTTCLDRMPPT